MHTTSWNLPASSCRTPRSFVTTSAARPSSCRCADDCICGGLIGGQRRADALQVSAAGQMVGSTKCRTAAAAALLALFTEHLLDTCQVTMNCACSIAARTQAVHPAQNVSGGLWYAAPLALMHHSLERALVICWHSFDHKSAKTTATKALQCFAASRVTRPCHCTSVGSHRK